jgi:AcrR family transcriptional regulator
MNTRAPAIDRRRQILDAAVRVFARQGFHSCRVADIADEAGVAYGLVYHYFRSKDQVMNELFTERWSLLLTAIEEADSREVSARDKLMQVIIVEVTRAANSFGRTHLPEINRAYESIEKIIADAQAAGAFRAEIDPRLASMWFYGAIEQLLSGWVFEQIPAGNGDFDRAREMLIEMLCAGLETRA